MQIMFPSLRASPTVSVELKFPVELNSFSDASRKVAYWRQKMNSIQREVSTLQEQEGMHAG